MLERIVDAVVAGLGHDQAVDGLSLLGQVLLDPAHVAQHLAHGLVAGLAALQLDDEPIAILRVLGEDVDAPDIAGMFVAGPLIARLGIALPISQICLRPVVPQKVL